MKVIAHFFRNKNESDIAFVEALENARDKISIGYNHMIQTATERQHFVVVSADHYKHVLGMQYDEYVIHGLLDVEVECVTPYSRTKLIDIIKSRKRYNLG